MTVHMSCVNVHTCAVTRTPTSSDVLVFVQPATRVAYQAGTGAACYVFQQAEVAVPLPLVMHVPPHHVPSHWQLPAPLEVVSEHPPISPRSVNVFPQRHLSHVLWLL